MDLRFVTRGNCVFAKKTCEVAERTNQPVIDGTTDRARPLVEQTFKDEVARHRGEEEAGPERWLSRALKAWGHEGGSEGGEALCPHVDHYDRSK